MGRAPTFLLRSYRTATRALAPVMFRAAAKKLRSFDVPEARINERKGMATLPRPDGQLIWFHGASVGESLSVLALITKMGEHLPDTEFLMTSGTATSAALVEKRLPPRTRHQYAPLDGPAYVDRFYAHWAPDAAIFVESELWPNLLMQGRISQVPQALLNARLSEKSVQGWSRWPDTARQLLSGFSILLAQNPKTADDLLRMGADPARVRVGANLKATSAPLPVDAHTLDTLRLQLGDRPIWVASSTHPGEEAAVLTAHKALLAQNPDLCLLIVPRHPERGDEVAGLIADADLSSARRTMGEAITPQTQVYLADTLGETGTWYALSPIVFLGGSLQPIGGHNPFEPAQSGAAILSGPHVTNFAETFTPLIAMGGAVEVQDAQDLVRQIQIWLQDADALDNTRAAALRFCETGTAQLDKIVDQLCSALDLGCH